MYSAKLVGNQMDTVFGLYLPEYEVPAPKVQTNYKEVPYRDGAIDKTAPDGVVTFEDREWSLVFQKTGEDVSAYDVPALSASLMNAIHGKSGEIIFDDDPNYKWVGRVFVENVQCENNGLIIANISLITQPYKYGIQDIVVTDTIETEVDEYQGSIASFEYGLGKELTKLLANIEPIQDLHGYTNPWPGGGGKNLANFVNGYDITAGGEIGANAKRAATLDPIPIESGVSYIYTSETELSCIYAVFNGDTLVRRLTGIASGTTLDTSNGTDLYVCIYGSSDYTATVETDKPMVRKSTEPAGYEPYSNICPISGRTGVSVYVGPTQDQQDATTYAVDWTSEAGTVYGGTLDVVTGVLTVNRITYAFDGTESFSNYASAIVCNKDMPVGYSMNGSDILCSRCTNAYIRFSNSSKIRVQLNKAYFGVSSVDELKAKLAAWNADGEPLQYSYELATPIAYQLTPRQIAMLFGINNVWSNSGEVEVAVSTMDKVTLSNGRKPQSPKISIASEGNIALMFFVKGTKHIVNLTAGEWSVPDLMLFEGDTDVYESGEGTVTYTYKEASL